MFTIGVVVEGKFDAAAIPEFIKKCRKGARVVARPCHGTILGKLRGILDELDARGRIDKVLVVCDGDNADRTVVRARMKSTLRGRRYRNFTPHFLVIPNSLEAWLLADETALESFARAKKTFPHPEELKAPKAELMKILSEGRIDYTPETARRIAGLANLESLSKRCPTFRQFRQAVIDC